MGRCVKESLSLRAGAPSRTVGHVSTPTGAERYLADRLSDPEYRAAYEEARRETEEKERMTSYQM